MFKTWTNQFEKNNYDNTIHKKYIVKIYKKKKFFFPLLQFRVLKRQQPFIKKDFRLRT